MAKPAQFELKLLKEMQNLATLSGEVIPLIRHIYAKAGFLPQLATTVLLATMLHSVWRQGTRGKKFVDREVLTAGMKSATGHI